jgi:hypothetical protein
VVEMEITAKCPYCERLNTYDIRPNVAVVVTCSCKKGSFYLKKIDRIEVVRNSLWTWEVSPGEEETSIGEELS